MGSSVQPSNTSLVFVLDVLSGAVFAATLAWALMWAIARVAPYLRFKGAFAELTLNSPGELARAALRAVERDLLLFAASACTALTAAGALVAYGGPRLAGLWMWLLFALACLLFIAWWVFLVRGFLAWRHVRYAARAHVALAAALARLAMQGQRVFHDVPLGEGTIDYLVVGKLGAYAITLVARRPGKLGNVVRINGRSIEFQDGFALLDTLALAERGARAVADGTAKGLSHRIHVLPVVAVPGWEIAPAQGQVGEVFLINEKSAVMLLRAGKPADHLMDQDAAALQEQLTRLCVNRSF
jgi:hypothetical protein